MTINVISEHIKSITLLCMITVVMTFNAYAVDFSILPAPQKISTHTYAWLGPHGGPDKDNKGFRMNLAFVVGTDAVAVIESGYSDAMAKEMLRHIGKITKAPVRFVINTNSQPDRMMGNAIFRQQGAMVIASDAEVKRMQQRVSDYASFSERLLGKELGRATIPDKFADRLVENSLTLKLGGVSVKIDNHKIAGHTPEPLIVEVVEDRVVWAGDTLYSGRIPAVIPGSNVPQWLSLYEKLRGYKGATFIPGHGKPEKLDGFEKSTYAYLMLLHRHMKKALTDGRDMQDAIDSLDQSQFSYLENYKELAGRNASWAFTQMEAASFE